ncbi:MAG TPA: glycosyltransferase family 39 protein [Dehalococcoidia bacterium]|nr:glycosyltransferase family 39 protein [Dehalococcoidia bacterium]
MFVRTGENGPLYYLILRFWIALTGTSEYAVRYLSLLAGVLVVPLSYAVGTRLVDRRTGCVAAAMAAGAPYLIWYAQDAKMYALVAALSLTSTYLLIRAAHKNRWSLWTAYLVATSLGFYLHLFGAFLAAGQALAYLATWRWHPGSLRRWLTALAGLTLPYLPLAVWQLPTFVQAPPMAHAFVPLPTLLRILLNRFSINHEMWPAWWVIAPFVILAILGLARLVADAAEGRIWLLVWLWAPILIVFLLSLRLPVFRDRYLTIVAPAYFLVLAAGLTWIFPAARRPWSSGVGWRVVAGIGLSLSLTGASVYALSRGPLSRTDFRGAAAFYAAHREPGDAVGFEATYAARPFLWYAPPDTAAVELPFTSGGMPPSEVDAILAQTTAGYRRLWLVEHEEWLWDNRRLVRGWLDRHGRLDRVAEFSGVRVSLFRLR